VTVGCGEQATRERTLKIAIMGSGGIGGYYGARLQQGGADVTFIARGEQLKAFRQNGIALEGDRPIHLPTVKATDDPATIGKVDMVIFSVKLRDTAAAAKQILPLIGPDTGIISLQNGVTKDDMLAPIVGRQHLLGGAAYIAVSIARPGVIKKAGTNERLAFGEFDNKVSKRAQAFLDACKAGGYPFRHLARSVAEVRDHRHDVEHHFGDALDHRTDPRQSACAVLRARSHAGSGRGRSCAGYRARSGLCRQARLGHRCLVARHARLDVARPGARPPAGVLAGAVIDLGSEKGIPTPCCRAVRDILAIYVDGKPA
jgi:2-dehydropantoate 2-reductase